MPRKKRSVDRFTLQKCPTGIQGLDEITMGGHPERASDPRLRQNKKRYGSGWQRLRPVARGQ